MNRSFSGNFKVGSKQKFNVKNNINVRFQTLLKTRGDHKAFEFLHSIAKIKTDLTQPSEQVQRSQTINYEKAQEDIKKHIRAIKKFSQDSTKNVNRQSENLQKQTIQNIKQESFKTESQYKHIKTGRKLVYDQQQNLAQHSLDILQKKVEELLYLKLMKKSNQKSFLSLRVSQDDLEKDLQQLILQIQQFTNLYDINKQGNEQIKQISQKIGILQKIIAQSFTQSEILKKYYYIKKLSRVPFTIFQNKIKQVKKQIYLNKSACLTSQYPSLHYSTISQTSFLKPQREAYNIQRKVYNKYQPNRQSLEKTSYQCQFLNYGALPTYSAQKYADRVTSLNLPHKKDTIYQTDFKQKKVQLMNSTELDCRQDKFRPTKISFMPKKLLQQKQNKPYTKIKGATKMPKARKELKDISFSNNNCDESSLFRNSDWFGRTGKSEYISKFAGQKAIIECLAKQTSLTNLKYQFRRQVNA